MATATHIELTQTRSSDHRTPQHRAIIKGLGLGKVGRTVRLKDTPAIRGMIEHVQYLVEVRVLPGDAPKFGRRA